MSVVEKMLLRNYFFLSTKYQESNRGMGERHVPVIWQSFSDCFSIFLFCKLWGSTETSTIKQGSCFLTFCKSSFQMPEHRPRAEPSGSKAFSKAKTAVVSG